MLPDKTTGKKTALICLYILTAATVAFAWIHSSMPVPASQAESGAVLDFLRPFLRLILPDELITETLVRKLAHFAEYGLLGTESLCILLIRHGDAPVSSDTKHSALKNIGLRKLVNTLYFAFSIAFVDETIQIFSGRGPLISDVWIDLGGFVCGGVAALVIYGIIRAARRKSENTDTFKQRV